MSLEVIHNIDHLPYKKVFFISNPTLAYQYVQKVMDTKRSRGMRVRYTYDVAKKQMTFEGRAALPVNTLVGILKSAFYMKQIG